jgi:hypothetical protein
MFSLSKQGGSSPSRPASVCSAKVSAFLRRYPRRLLELPVPLRWRSAHTPRPSVIRWSRPSRQATHRLPLLAARARSCHCHAGLPWPAMSATLFTQVPVSQRLKPQSSMPARFCTSSFPSAAQRVCHSLSRQGRRTSSHVSSSKQERVGSHQPPNPSFKRTRLRRSA